MADKYGRPESLAEIVSQYTGIPLEEIEAKQEPITEELLKSMQELDRKVHSLSREERLKRLHEAVERENKKGIF